MKRINLVSDPRATNRGMWISTDDSHEPVIVDGEPAMMVTEVDGAGRLSVEMSERLQSANLRLKSGDVIRTQVEVKTLQPWTLNIRLRVVGAGQIEYSSNSVAVDPASGWVTVSNEATVVEAAESTLIAVDINPASVGMPVGSRYYFRKFLIEVNTDGEYFDGSTPTIQGADSMQWTVHRWLGEPDNSYSEQDPEGIAQWTRDWWESLPEAVKSLDAVQNQEIGGYPMLRWMDGVGGLAGEIREVSDGLYNGVYTDPDTVPDKALPWLALMLGISPSQRGDSTAQLRQHIKTLVSVGRSALGTRASIEEMVYTLFGAESWARPHPTLAHTIVVYMREVDLPEEGRSEIVQARLKRAGVLPAGHQLIVESAAVTWDSWEEAAGVTWAEKESRLPRWVDSDSAGVIVEE